MKKVSKFMSVALVLALALSLFAGLNVFATGATPTAVPSLSAEDNAYVVEADSKAVTAINQNQSGLTLKITCTEENFSSVSSTTVEINSSYFTYLGSNAITYDSANKSIEIPDLKYFGNGNTIEVVVRNSSDSSILLQKTFTIRECVLPEVSPTPVPPPEPTPTPEPTPAPTAEPDLPKVMVKDFSFGGTSVEAGKEFTLDLTLFTTSGNTNLEDVMVGLNFGEAKNVSLASGSMNTYVGTLAPGATKHITYKIITDATIEPGAIGITVQLTSKNGEPNSSPISIPVTQPDRFEITGIEAPENITLGEEGYLSVTFVNKGKSPVNNLSAEIQGTNLANPGQSQFLGNIAAGTENSVDFSVMASAEGTINGKVLLSYEDAKGEIVTLEKEFSCMVQAMPEMDPGMMDPGMMDPTMGDDVKSGMPWWGWLLIALGVAAVAAAVVLVVLKKKKAKKLAELEDDDEDI